ASRAEGTLSSSSFRTSISSRKSSPPLRSRCLPGQAHQFPSQSPHETRPTCRRADRNDDRAHLGSLAHSPFPNAVGRLLVEGMSGVFQNPANLAAVVRFVRNQIAQECNGVRLEPFDLASLL